jgi:hypothetical protein
VASLEMKNLVSLPRHEETFHNHILRLSFKETATLFKKNKKEWRAKNGEYQPQRDNIYAESDKVPVA